MQKNESFDSTKDGEKGSKIDKSLIFWIRTFDKVSDFKSIPSFYIGKGVATDWHTFSFSQKSS